MDATDNKIYGKVRKSKEMDREEIAHFSGKPTVNNVEREAERLGMKATWNSYYEEWTVKVPGTPIEQWYFTTDNTDALLTMRHMARQLRRGKFKPQEHKEQKYLTAGEFLKTLKNLHTTKVLYTMMGTYVYPLNRTALYNMVCYVHGANDDAPVPFKFVKTSKGLELIVGYSELLDEAHSPIRQEEGAADDTGGV